MGRPKNPTCKCGAPKTDGRSKCRDCLRAEHTDYYRRNRAACLEKQRIYNLDPLRREIKNLSRRITSMGQREPTPERVAVIAEREARLGELVSARDARKPAARTIFRGVVK